MQVVWFAEIKWDYLRTRKQQIIRRRPAGVDLVYLEPWVRGRDNPGRLRERDGIRVATIPFIKAVPGGPLRTLLDVPVARDAVDALARRRVAQRLAEAGVRADGATFVISNVYAIRVARAFHSRRLVYDCNDAHADFPGLPGWTRRYLEETFRGADRVVVTSRALREEAVRLRGGGGEVTVVGNGVDFAAFRRGAGAAPEPAGGEVRIGYLGAIAPWFDFGLVEAMARARPAWRFVLVGPVLAGVESELARLRALPNVDLRPAVAHEDVPGVLRGFSVGIIPFRRTPLTAGVNPNKLYEYLAVGLPAVATPFSPEVDADARTVALADGADGFVRACETFAAARAQAQPRAELEARAVEIAAAHDWDRIAAEFWAVVRE
jgi:glycosyltransferase involved in cell wall biosynthesis